MRLANASAWRLAAWAGRLLLVGAVAFWWGGFVVLHLLRLAFPTLLPLGPSDVILNAETEGSVMNAVSAAALLAVALLALANVAASRRRATGWTASIGWAVLAVTAATLAWDEIADRHNGIQEIVKRLVFGEGLGGEPWTLAALWSPLILAFALVMGVFVRKGLQTPAVRAPITLGLSAWLLAAAHEATYPVLFHDRARLLEGVLEETLEFGGALLILLGAVAALRSQPASRQWPGACGGRWRTLLAGSIATVAVLGGLVVLAVFRAPFEDSRTHRPAGTFHITLPDQWSAVQVLRSPVAPIAQIDLRLFTRDPHGRGGTVTWRLLDGGPSGEILREGLLTVPAGSHRNWFSIDLAQPLVLAGDQRPAVQLVADVEREGHLRIGATKTNRYPGGQLWIQGAPAWPDQSLEFVVYSMAEPTWSKLRAIWRTLTSDWRWPVLAADVALALTLITFIPALLVATACRCLPAPTAVDHEHPAP